jgi:hypothetical protein
MGEYVVPISFIDSISITESIYSPVATGIIACSDSGFVERCLKYKDFNLNLVFADSETDNDYLISFAIHSFDTTEYDLKNQLINKRVLKFSSFYSIELLTNDKYLNLRKKTSTEMIKTICNLLKVKSNILTNTTHKWDFVSPNWSLNESINYILSRTLDSKENGGFLFFPDLYNCKVNFTNYYELLSGKIGFMKYPLLYDTINDSYQGNIIDLKIVKEFNALREFRKGLNNTRSISFDVLTGKIVDDKNMIDKIIKSNDKIYGYFPVNKDDMSTGLNVDVYCLNDEYLIKSLKSQKYNDMLMNQLALEIICNGDYARKLGMITAVISTIFASDQQTNTKNIDEKISGSYLISDIEHLWSKNLYQQKIKCIKSGYSKVSDDKNLYVVK